MTAINAVGKGPRGYLLTDTAAYDLSGVVKRFVSKVITVPHLRVALASRGAMASLPIIALELSRAAASFDEIIEFGGEVVRDAHDDGSFEWGEGCESEVDLVTVGWSDSRRCVEAYALSTFDHPGLTPFVFYRHDLILAPWPLADDLDAAGITTGGQFLTFSPACDLLRVMELQRATRGQTGSVCKTEAHVVGGQAIMTEIGERSITQRIVHRWPDEIGKLIEPKVTCVA